MERLKRISDPAPYGKGLNVVVDRSMKKAWEINASNILGASPENFMNSTLLELAASALRNLQLGWLLESFNNNELIGVHLSKLFLYDTGGHYKRLHDSDSDAQGIVETLKTLTA